MSVHILLLIGTMVSHNSGISASEDNFVSYVKAGGNGNMSSILAG